MTQTEVNFDGIVGPTHHYGGLSPGNLASHRHGGEVARPREAALQGLAKMEFLAGCGIAQAVLPPPLRPALSILRAAGFLGSEEAIIREAWQEAPGLLSACYSASAMWTANAATFTPRNDTKDGKSHITPANLVSMFHRSIEPPATARVLRRIFGDVRFFVHHDPLPPGRALSDEGAANHTRLAAAVGRPGIHFFVYGFEPFKEDLQGRFPARQSLEASRSIARLHRIPAKCCLFARQAPEAIDAGVFHNDVASVGNGNLFLYHERAFAGGREIVRELAEKFTEVCGGLLVCAEVPVARVPLEEAVRTYLFNSQLVTLPEGGMLLLAPAECRESSAVDSVIKGWVQDEANPIHRVSYVNLRESMRNGGGPACLRLRVSLSQEEKGALGGRVLLTPELSAELSRWIQKHYRETLAFSDLADLRLIEESRRAVRELSGILDLGEPSG